MAEIDEWQTRIPTLKERVAHVFNSELLSDVKFIVADSSADLNPSKKAKMVIPAHKFVLAISSPVFSAMFYGQMAETADSVHLPDCDYESLLEFFRYLYSEEVNLNGDNVVQVFYLAKKYMVSSLVQKCNTYLQDNVEGSNVFSVLLHAQKFGVKDLEDLCWEVIKTQAKEALISDEFVTMERTVVETVVKMNRIYIKEVELFKAVDRWADKEMERQGLTSAGNIKRQVLGEEIVKSIRFSQMSQKEFASVVLDCNILTMKEVADMMKYHNGITTSPFKDLSRFGPLLQYFRFHKAKHPFDNYSEVLKKSHSLTLTTNKAIFLHGVGMFGREGGSYTVDVEIAELNEGRSSLLRQSGDYVSEKWIDRRPFVFKVLFQEPVYLEKDRAYKVTSSVNGLPAWRGTHTKSPSEVSGSGVTFKITENVFESKYDIPIFIFSVF